jgi:hypothetical protein
MKEDIKEAWKKNLRSGKFAQGSGQLRTWDPDEKVWKYCCLGVLCEMSGLGEWVEYADDMRTESTYLGNEHYLPVAVAEWAGIDIENDDETSVQQRLGTANDEEGSSFFKIANLIDTMHDL